jgi:hypothetical protein
MATNFDKTTMFIVADCKVLVLHHLKWSKDLTLRQFEGASCHSLLTIG